MVRTTRRRFLATTGIATGLALAGCSAPAQPESEDTPASSKQAQNDEISFDGWFDNVENFDGVVDRTGQSAVTVQVGAQGNGGAFAFAPAAVAVDAGATVVWEWTGDGGMHNVEATDGSFESDMVDQAGHAFEQSFESDVRRYFCMPHEAMGMKGAIVVR